MSVAITRPTIVFEECFDSDGLATVSDPTVLANTAFTSAGGTLASISFPHYTELAREPGTPMPFRGSNCLRMNFQVGDGVTAAFLEDPDIDTAVADTQAIRFMLYLSSDWTMANDDTMTILEIDSVGAAEAVITIQFTTAGGLLIGWGEAAVDETVPITVGVWHAVELHLHSAAAAAGTIDLWLDGVAQTQSTGATGATITDMELGPQGRDSGTTGSIYFDQVVLGVAATAATVDRLHGLSVRYPETIQIHSSQTVCLGSGVIENVQLLAGADVESSCQLFDTDRANAKDESRKIAHIQGTGARETVDPAGMPVTFSRGVFVDLTKTDDGLSFDIRALIKLKYASGYGSPANTRRHGLRRLPTGGGDF